MFFKSSKILFIFLIIVTSTSCGLLKENYGEIKYITTDFDKHPKYIKDKLVTLQENQFGFDCFGLKNKIKPDIVEYLRHFNRKYIN